MDVYRILKTAVRSRQPVGAWYDGHWREFCPHILGYKRREPRCLVYQFAGDSGSQLILPGSPQNWRCFKVADLSAVRVLRGPWHTGPAHSRPQRCIDIVDVDSEIPELPPLEERRREKVDSD